MSSKSDALLTAKLGKRIRDIRKQKSITLIELSEATDVAQATLSRMENGQMMGTVESHRKIAEALGVSLSNLYDGIDSRSEGVKKLKATDKRKVVAKNESTRSELLISNVSSKRIVPELITLSSRGKTPMDRGDRDVEKFVWVLDGKIKVAFQNAEYELEANETLYFDASTPHRLINLGKHTAKILSVSSQP